MRTANATSPIPPKLLMAFAAGWPVEFKPALANESSRVDLPLKPGRAVTVQFVDGAGAPVPDVRVSLMEWNGQRIIELYLAPALDGQFPRRSDAAGKLEWTAAADDRLSCNFWKEGYQRVEGYKLTPAAGVYTVTLMPEPDAGN